MLSEDSDQLRHLLIIMIMIISIFKEDIVFSITANLPYGQPMNTYNDYYQTIFFILICK